MIKSFIPTPWANISNKNVFNAPIRIYAKDKEGDTNIIEGYNKDRELQYKLDSEGFLRIEYRDEYVASAWMTPQGAAAPDEVDVTIGGISYRFMSFDGVNIEERKSNSFEINHDVATDGLNKGIVEVEQHIHCMPSNNNAGVAKFFVDYCYLPAFGTPIVQTPLSLLINIEANSLHKHLLAGVTIPKPTSGFNIGDVIFFNIRRTPTDEQDTYASDILFIKTALHVPVNSRGSRQIYTK